MSTYTNLRRARWLEKLANMKQDCTPHMRLGAWIINPRRNGTADRSQQSIRHAFVNTLNTSLGFINTDLVSWMEVAKSREILGKGIEYFPRLPEASYRRQNAKN